MPVVPAPNGAKTGGHLSFKKREGEATGSGKDHDAKNKWRVIENTVFWSLRKGFVHGMCTLSRTLAHTLTEEAV